MILLIVTRVKMYYFYIQRSTIMYLYFKKVWINQYFLAKNRFWFWDAVVTQKQWIKITTRFEFLISGIWTIAKFDWERRRLSRFIKVQAYFAEKQQQPPEIFYLKGVLEKFATFTEKHVCQRDSATVGFLWILRHF